MRLTQEKVISRLEKVHGSKYDFSDVIYKDWGTKLRVNCYSCGLGWDSLLSNLEKGSGCPYCSKRNAHNITDNETFRLASANRFPDSQLDYSKVKYHNFTTAVTLTCPLHGDFERTPCNHMKSKHSCTTCSYIASAKYSTSTTEEFISKSKLLHGDLYCYEKTEYINNTKCVDICCKTHGIFKIAPSKHISSRKSGCQKCSRIAKTKAMKITHSEFLQRAFNVHRIKYDYSLVDIGDIPDLRSDVKIICKTHGIFNQSAEGHLMGHGCSECAGSGYNTAKIGNFYILKSESVTKIGITNRDVSLRIRDINKKSPFKFELAFFIKFENGKIPQKLEKRLLKNLASRYDRVVEIYDGSTECFLDVDYDWLIKETTSLCSEFIPTK